MLDKLKVTAIVGIVMQVLRVWFPALDISEGFEGALQALANSLYIIVPVVVGWFTRERAANVTRLRTK